MLFFTVLCAVLAAALFVPIRLCFCIELARRTTFAFAVCLFRIPIWMRHGVFVREGAGRYSASLYDADDVFRKKLSVFPTAPIKRNTVQRIRRILVHQKARHALFRAFEVKQMQIDTQLASKDVFLLPLIYGALCAALGAVQTALHARSVQNSVYAQVHFVQGASFFAAACMLSTTAGKLIAAAVRAARICAQADAAKKFKTKEEKRHGTISDRKHHAFDA